MSEQQLKNPNLQVRSPSQLAILAQAREKAKIVRAENARLKQEERDLIKMEKERAKAVKALDIKQRYAKLNELDSEPQEEPSESESEPPAPTPAPQPAAPKTKKTKKKKPSKQKVVMVSDSDSSESEEEEQIIYMKKPKTKKKPKVVYRDESPPPAAPPKYRYIQPEHEELYKKMFS